MKAKFWEEIKNINTLQLFAYSYTSLDTKFLVKITFLYKLVAKKEDFVQSKLQISLWKDRATVAW